MAQGQSGSSSSPIAVLSPTAEDDRWDIYQYTTQLWDIIQADEYDDFLSRIMQDLADSPSQGQMVPNKKPLRVFIAKWPGSKLGHRIIYPETEYGIYILRILHTAMKWQLRLRD